jgi:hypothetical protein
MHEPEVQPERRPARNAGGRPRRRFALRPLLIVLGGYHVILGIAMAVAPRDFYESIAGYPPYNDHFLRDVATFYLALGAVTLLASARRSWQVPILAFTVAQYGLHVINHIVDVTDSEPGWHGPANVVSLALIGALAWWLYQLAKEREGE